MYNSHYRPTYNKKRRTFFRETPKKAKKIKEQNQKYNVTPFSITSDDIVKMAAEYSQCSSLHGLRYVGNKDLHIIERLFWIVAFLIAVSMSLYFITNLTTKWLDMPVIMSLSPKSTPITTLPFPAITICNMNNARRSVAQQILSKPTENTIDIEKKLLSDFCNEDTILGNTMEDNVTISWQAVQNFMIKVSQPCREMMLSCIWHGEPQKCSDIFNAALTDEGMCCSFNKVKNEFIFRRARQFSDLNLTFTSESVDWTPENGFPERTPTSYLPWRPQGAGSHLGLTLVLDTELDEYYCASEASHGFKMILHTPIETPKISAFGTLIRPGTETQIVIKPYINMATPQLKHIDQDKRQCYFSDERVLRFYRTYTEKSCTLECEANFTLHFCQCVMYYMPKDAFTRICGKKDIPCANRARLAIEIKLNSNMTTKWVDGNHKRGCGCLPGCFSLIYHKITAFSELSSQFKIKDEYTGGKNISYFKKNMAVVHFFFTETQFTGIIKGELFGFTEFLSNTGGLLGLFMGFSFLSAFEAIYFITLRFWCVVSKKRSSTVSADDNALISVTSNDHRYARKDNAIDKFVLPSLQPYIRPSIIDYLH